MSMNEGASVTYRNKRKNKNNSLAPVLAQRMLRRLKQEAMQSMRYYRTASITAAIIVGGGVPAWALQSHPAPEGIYVHQMAHVLFMVSLGYLFWHTRKTQESGNKGWKYLQIFCLLFFCWNLLAFTGHEALKYLEPTDFIDKNTLSARISGPLDLTKLLYYITKMDHFLVVPAFLALVISLRKFYKKALEEAER